MGTRGEENRRRETGRASSSQSPRCGHEAARQAGRQPWGPGGAAGICWAHTNRPVTQRLSSTPPKSKQKKLQPIALSPPSPPLLSSSLHPPSPPPRHNTDFKGLLRHWRSDIYFIHGKQWRRALDREPRRLITEPIWALADGAQGHSSAGAPWRGTHRRDATPFPFSSARAQRLDESTRAQTPLDRRCHSHHRGRRIQCFCVRSALCNGAGDQM